MNIITTFSKFSIRDKVLYLTKIKHGDSYNNEELGIILDMPRHRVGQIYEYCTARLSGAREIQKKHSRYNAKTKKSLEKDIKIEYNLNDNPQETKEIS